MNNTNNQKIITNYFQSESPEATEFLRLYLKLKNINSNNHCNNFMFTSAELGEGKSTISTLFAITVSRYKKTKTLLIDCDLRRPTIHKKFKIDKAIGMTEVLSGKIQLKESFKKTRENNLMILTAGEHVHSPAALFKPGNVREVLEECKFYFETIIIDSPPVVPISDPLLLGNETDGVIFVVKAGKTKKDVVKRAQQLLIDSGIKILGVILNNSKEVLPYYYNYKYYGYKYYKTETD